MDSEFLCMDCANELEYRGPWVQVIEETHGSGRCECCGAYILQVRLNNGTLIQRDTSPYLQGVIDFVYPTRPSYTPQPA